MIMWLASYPKSGNTWVRTILTALEYTEDGIYNPDNLSKIVRFPNPEFFDEFTKNYHNANEIKKLWIYAQQKINLKNEFTYLKTHHLNCKMGVYPFTNNQNTSGSIYIIRDPRNVVTSFANHFAKDIEGAKNVMFNVLMTGTEPPDIFELVGSWSQNYESWTKFNKNHLLIKYEDLISDPEKEIIRIINYIKKFKKLDVSKEKIKNTIETTSFENLKKHEKKGNFKESITNAETKEKIAFFNLGKKNNWQTILDPKIAKEIEEKFSKEMLELGYL